MDILFKVDRVLYNFETETICTTSDEDEVINVCNEMEDEDFIVTLWVDGKFVDVYRDLEEKETRDMFNKFS